MKNVKELLRGQRLILRKFRSDDADAIYRGYASRKDILTYVSWSAHKSVEDTREYLEYAGKAWEEGHDHSWALILKERSQLIGGIGCIDEGGKVYLGYILDPDYWGHGFATESVNVLVQYLISRNDLHKIYSMTDVDHVVSQKVLLKAGFRKEAVLSNWMEFPNQQKWKDVIIFDYPM